MTERERGGRHHGAGRSGVTSSFVKRGNYHHALTALLVDVSVAGVEVIRQLLNFATDADDRYRTGLHYDITERAAVLPNLLPEKCNGRDDEFVPAV